MVAFKNRYMVLEFFVELDKNPENPPRNNDKKDELVKFLDKAIRDSILVNYGQCGLASSVGSLQIKYVNSITKLCIIRASREDYQKVWSAITMVSSIGNRPASFNLLDLSGSIKACKKAALSCEEAKFEQYKLVKGGCGTDEFNKQMQNLERIKVLEH